MTWSAAFNVDDVSFVSAVDWFAQRVPITDSEFLANVEQGRRQAFWIAGVTQAELIRQVHDSLRKAIDSGVPFEDWRQEIGPALRKAWFGKLTAGEQAARTETVFRNWVQASYNRARWHQMDAPAVKKIRPFRMFDGTADHRQSEICKACDGTILPADDPWWDTHRPPLHHRCRSGIRALRTSQAFEKGITKDPPDIGAQDGFGNGAEYKGPDRKKFPNKLKPPKAPKPVKQKPPEPLLKRKAAEFAAALELADGGVEARKILRQQITELLPNAVSKDPALSGGHSMIRSDTLLTQIRAEAAHAWDGTVHVKHATLQLSQAGVRSLAKGDKLSPQEADSISALLHEELHGFTRATRQTYVHGTSALVFEEVGTELHARWVTSQLVGDNWKAVSLPPKAYQRYINGVQQLVMAELNVDADTALDRILAAHSESQFGAGEGYRDTVTYAREWLRALPGNPANRDETALNEQVRRFQDRILELM